mmetsp:Transcript_10234/g.1520  ORF Transcript_10234/g.1520 Transcript_10234/m.1520 type:complete len:182 (-) Transcript_10234:917-1462(-)
MGNRANSAGHSYYPKMLLFPRLFIYSIVLSLKLIGGCPVRALYMIAPIEYKSHGKSISLAGHLPVFRYSSAISLCSGDKKSSSLNVVSYLSCSIYLKYSLSYSSIVLGSHMASSRSKKAGWAMSPPLKYTDDGFIAEWITFILWRISSSSSSFKPRLIASSSVMHIMCLLSCSFISFISRI